MPMEYIKISSTSCYLCLRVSFPLEKLNCKYSDKLQVQIICNKALVIRNCDQGLCSSFRSSSCRNKAEQKYEKKNVAILSSVMLTASTSTTHEFVFANPILIGPSMH